MKFKQANEPKNEEVDNKLYASFNKILQLEEDKIELVVAAINYFYVHGNMKYKKFFKELHKMCCKTKLCFEEFMYIKFKKLPERTIASIDLDDFKEDIKFFELLSTYEDDYDKLIKSTISEAFEEQDWDVYEYLMKKLDEIDHLCCRALEAVKNKSDLLDLILCEQHSLEK